MKGLCKITISPIMAVVLVASGGTIPHGWVYWAMRNIIYFEMAKIVAESTFQMPLIVPTRIRNRQGIIGKVIKIISRMMMQCQSNSIIHTIPK